MSSFLLVVFRFPNAVFPPGSCFVFAFSCSSFPPLCCVVFSSVAFRFFLVGLKYLTCSVALRGSRAFGATTLTAASSPFFTDTLPLARAGGAPCLAVRRSRMSLTRVTGQYSLRGPLFTINLPELQDHQLPAGYSRDQELLLQIPVQVKVRARSAEAPEEGRPPEVPEGDGQRTKRPKAQQPATEAASLPLACALETPTVVVVSAVVPPPIRDPLETPTQPSLIRSPTLETPTPIPSEQQIDAEQASSSGGADLGPGEAAGVPSAGSAVHEAVLPGLGTIEVQDSPTPHETAAVGARSSRGQFAAAYDDPAMAPEDSQQPIYDSNGIFIG